MAIANFPLFELPVTLPFWKREQSTQSGQSVTIRPVQPTDAAQIHAMHYRLSPESLHYRYLQTRIPSLSEIERTCNFDSEIGAGFVATIQNGGEQIVGVAYYVREPGGLEVSAEIGILVEDRFQGQGIGRKLWQQLHKHAAKKQIDAMRVYFDATHWRVLRLIQGSGYEYTAGVDLDANDFKVKLEESQEQSWIQRLLAQFQSSVHAETQMVSY